MNSIYAFRCFLMIAGLGVVGCAHPGTEARLDTKVNQETTIRNEKDLRLTSDKALDESRLNENQKIRIRELRTEMGRKIAGLREESIRLRSLLVKDVLGEKYNKREVASLQRRIRANQDSQLSILFEGVEQANAILGRQSNADARERFLNEILTPVTEESSQVHSLQ